MLAPAYCNGCGKRLEVPAGYAKAKMRCPDCGVFTELPKEVREQGQSTEARAAPPPPKPKPAKPAVKPAAPAPKAEADDGYGFLSEPSEQKSAPPPAAPEEVEIEELADDDPENETLISGTEEDDLNPYTVTGDAPTKRCPECDKKVPIRAKVCVHCGYSFASGEKAKRTFEPVNREWENGWPFQKRLMLFVILQVINLVTLIMSVCGGFGFGMSFSMILLTVGLQAFLVGTYDKLTLTRNQKGKVTLTSHWRIAFIPRLPQPLKWKEHESLIIVQSNVVDPFDWAMAFILLTYGVIPGILFWWYVIRPDKFTVTLCKDHGFPETPIFRTRDEERAKEIMTTVSDVTTLPLHK